MPKTSAKDSKQARPRVARVSDLLRLPDRAGRPRRDRHGGHPGLRRRQGRGQEGAGTCSGRGWPTCRSGCSPRAGPAAPRSLLLVLQGMDTSGKGGHGAPRRRPGRPAGRDASPPSRRRPGRSWRTTSCGGSSARLPGARDDRRLRPVALRGRRRRAGAATSSSAAPGSVATPRSTGSRRHWSPTAPPSSSASCTSPRRSPGTGCSGASTSRTSSGSSTPATSTAGPSGTR